MKKKINDNSVPNQSEKDLQLMTYNKDHSNGSLTTNQGVGVPNTDDSLKAGTRGPTLIEDFIMREKITHFDHERIPERVVHARGFAAHGYFEVYKPMTKLTKAKFLSDPSVKTPVFVRFSTVVGSRGSADTVRDVRGFATKFYTEDGNYDIVGNNMPVFFIQDAMKFPDFVHAIKPEPNKEIPQASSAHDTLWDFVVSTPETAHTIMWLMSDRAIPRSYRMMEGFGVNTFKLINDEGVARFVKFHWKPLLGVHSLVWDEAQKLAGKNPDFNRKDLWDAINKGDFPEYELGIQIVEANDEFKFDFDILDPTKLWPEELIPLQRIGKMTLNRNVTNFFAETEQVAFCPANLVPGIDFSNDPLLQGRLFSYLDTQLSRLGGPNFHEIPINKPIKAINNNQRDGLHRMAIDEGRVSYFPNTLNNNNTHPTVEGESAFAHHQEKMDGTKIRMRSKSFTDHFSQATLFWNSMSSIEKQHIIDAFIFEVGNVIDLNVRQHVVDMFNNVDGGLATQIAKGVGAIPPKKPIKSKITAKSPALSMANTIKNPATRKVAIIMECGFCMSEAEAVMNALKAANISFEIVSSKLGELNSSEGKKLNAGMSFLTTASINYDAIYIPGGRISIDSLVGLGDAIHFINEAFKHAKTIAASNEGVDLLNATQINGIIMADMTTSGESKNDCGVVTIRNNKDMTEFNADFISCIGEHRHWCRCNLKGTVPA